VLELRGRGLASGLSEGLAVGYVFVDLGAMIKLVGEGGMDIGHRQAVVAGNLVDTFPQPFMPHDDIAHGNTMACSAGGAV